MAESAAAEERPATSAELEALRAELARNTEQLERVEALLRATLKRRPSKRYEAPRAVDVDAEREKRAAEKMAAPKRRRKRA